MILKYRFNSFRDQVLVKNDFHFQKWYLKTYFKFHFFVQFCFKMEKSANYTKPKLKWTSAVVFRNFSGYLQICGKSENPRKSTFHRVNTCFTYKMVFFGIFIFKKRTLNGTFNFQKMRKNASFSKKTQIIPNTNSNGPRLSISQISNRIFGFRARARTNR